jgi:hypothetical protein
MASEFGDLAAWSFADEESDACDPLLGWPVHFGDVAWAPLFADEGLLVASRSSLLDYLRYPDGGGPLEGGWREYGFDSYNTGYHPGCEEPLTGDMTFLSRAPISAGPNPGRGFQQVVLQLDRDAERADVDIFDVQGRRIRSLLSGPLAQGVHAMTWNGLDERGNRAPVGIYFYQFSVDGSVAGRVRTVHLR